MRATAILTTRLERELAAYAVAAGAAGVGILALSQPADAKIIYTSAHKNISRGQTYRLDVNHDGTADFTFHNEFQTTDTGGSSWLSVRPVGSNAVRGFVDHYGIGWADALKLDARIGPKKTFIEQAARMVFIGVGSSGTVTLGRWINVRKRYLGLRFKIHGETHYGWARLNVSHPLPFVISARLTGYAYETNPDKPIVAGDMGPTGESLGHLALGAADREQKRQNLVAGH